MRKIGSLPSVAKAERFRLILEGSGIASHKPDDPLDGMDIWIMSDDDLARAKEIYSRFQAEPDSAAFTELALAGQAMARQKPQRSREQAPRLRQSHRRLLGPYPVTLGLVIVASLVYLFSSSFSGTGRTLAALTTHYLRFSRYRTGMPEILSGELWRLVTPIFLHGGLLHILFNMLWVWQLGRQIESMESSRRLLGLVLLIAIPSNALFYFIAGPSFGGISGVNYGLFAYIWCMDTYGGPVSYRADPQLSQIFLVWYLVCVFLTLVVHMNVANSIHGMGAAIGFLVALARSGGLRRLTRAARFKQPLMRHVSIGLALLAAGILVDLWSF